MGSSNADEDSIAAKIFKAVTTYLTPDDPV